MDFLGDVNIVKVTMEENPFPDLKIDSSDFMENLSGRSKCSKCEKSRKYYCYNCYQPVPEIEDKVPKVKLPIKIDVIKHPSEVDSKSTAVHAVVIAPDDVTVYTYPCIPDYNTDETVLVFPGENSITLTDLSNKWMESSDQSKEKRKHFDENDINCTSDKRLKLENLEHSLEEKLNGDITVYKDDKKVDDTYNTSASNQTCGTGANRNDDSCQISLNNDNKLESQTIKSSLEFVPSCKVKRIVFVDSTWNQTKTICCDERLKGLQCIELKTRETKFWRHQKDIPNTYLSTIEAIYYFLREFHEQFVPSEYSGQYDNLLFFFTFMYRKLRTLYKGGNELKAYKERAGK